jgi:hypothetical protein
MEKFWSAAALLGSGAIAKHILSRPSSSILQVLEYLYVFGIELKLLS